MIAGASREEEIGGNMALSNLSKTYLIQGSNGPEKAKRPSDEVLRRLRESPEEDLLGMARLLVESEHTLDMAVDIWKWDYWKVMNLRRRYGYNWIPAFTQSNVAVAPGLSMLTGGEYNPDAPPMGAILVPPSEQEDPNYESPKAITAPQPPPDGQVVFGPPITYGQFLGAYSVGTGTNVPPGTHATKDGLEFVYVVLGRLGTLRYQRLWVPTGE